MHRISGQQSEFEAGLHNLVRPCLKKREWGLHIAAAGLRLTMWQRMILSLIACLHLLRSVEARDYTRSLDEPCTS